MIKERKMRKAKGLGLKFIWATRLKLRTKGDELWAEGNKLWTEADKLRAEADELWAEAIREVYGNIKREWKNYNSEKGEWECHLETGEIFKP